MVEEILARYWLALRPLPRRMTIADEFVAVRTLAKTPRRRGRALALHFARDPIEFSRGPLTTRPARVDRSWRDPAALRLVQRQLEERNCLVEIRSIRSNLDEPQFAIEVDGKRHAGPMAIKPHTLVAQAACLRETAFE